ncbi:hypothetical protein ACFVSQ_37785 [Streptomyces niveus]|uniref:hypothetical protein n=1 Tax=Streptomyces niveus TaxID=193462 RepID=UPI0036F01EB0
MAGPAAAVVFATFFAPGRCDDDVALVLLAAARTGAGTAGAVPRTTARAPVVQRPPGPGPRLRSFRHQTVGVVRCGSAATFARLRKTRTGS